MKRIEDAEKLTLEELERIADDRSVTVPEHLGEKIENRILAAEILRQEDLDTDVRPFEKSKSTLRRPAMTFRRSIVAISAVAAAIAAVAIGLNLHSRSITPVDTFDSPEEAYAQVEKTFAMIGSKVSKGMEIADAALPKMKKTSEILNQTL